jgi:hypothetical protein
MASRVTSRIDTRRGNIPRSKYILSLRILQNTCSKNTKLVEEKTASGIAIKNNRSQNLPDCILNRPYNQASQGVHLESQEKVVPDLVNICEAVGCLNKATISLVVNVGPERTIQLFLCKNCVPKFEDGAGK